MTSSWLNRIQKLLGGKRGNLARQTVRTAGRRHRTELGLEALEERSVPAGGLVGNLVVFGDSLSDTGNVFLGTGGTFPTPGVYALGRFSGGAIWADTLTEYLGEGPLVPSLAGGLDFAFGGATVAAENTQVPNLGQQVGQYLTGIGLPGGIAHLPAADDLFAIWAGANDFVYTFNSPTGPIGPQSSAAGVLGALDFLAGYGGKQFLVNNLPPLGQTPFFKLLDGFYPGTSAVADGWTTAFNATLDAGLDQFRATHAGVKVIEVDVSGLFAKTNSPANPYGFANRTSPVGEYVAPGQSVFLKNVTVAEPETYEFFDGIHPGTTTHQIIGLQAAANVYSALGVHTITVNDKTDLVNPLSGTLSIREAINLANTIPGRDSIFFALGSGANEIKLSGKQLSVSENLQLIGTGALTISAEGKSRILEVKPGASVSLSRVTLVKGSADFGGAIFNAGMLTLNDVNVMGNSAGTGGGVYNTGALNVFGGTFSANMASKQGGAIASNGAAASTVLLNVVVVDNLASGVTAQGGGVANTGGSSTTIVLGLIRGNRATGKSAQGGGIFNDASSSLSVALSLITGNEAIGVDGGSGLGGGIYTSGRRDRVSLFLSLIVGNFASTRGNNIL